MSLHFMYSLKFINIGILSKFRFIFLTLFGNLAAVRNSASKTFVFHHQAENEIYVYIDQEKGRVCLK